jgi:hypothetical protein
LIFGIYLPVSAQQDDPIYRLPAGTRIKLKLDAEINSRVSTVNDTFLAFVASPVTVRDAVVLPAGTVIEGRVRGVKQAGAGGRTGQMDLIFETLRLSNGTRPIDGVLVTKLGPESSKGLKLGSILGGVAAGAAVGGSTGSGRRVLMGAATGAGLGTALALLLRGKNVRISKNAVFEIELRSPVVLPVSDY